MCYGREWKPRFSGLYDDSGVSINRHLNIINIIKTIRFLLLSVYLSIPYGPTSKGLASRFSPLTCHMDHPLGWHSAILSSPHDYRSCLIIARGELWVDTRNKPESGIGLQIGT